MATTLTYGAVSITLPPDLSWPDEYAWRDVESKRAYSITGALIIESALKLSGRPITLAADDESAWMTRAVLDTLRTAASLPGQPMTLTLRGVPYAVRFDHQAGALDARPAIDFSDPDATDFYIVTLRFIVTP